MNKTTMQFIARGKRSTIYNNSGTNVYQMTLDIRCVVTLPMLCSVTIWFIYACVWKCNWLKSWDIVSMSSLYNHRLWNVLLWYSDTHNYAGIILRNFQIDLVIFYIRCYKHPTQKLWFTRWVSTCAETSC